MTTKKDDKLDDSRDNLLEMIAEESEDDRKDDFETEDSEDETEQENAEELEEEQEVEEAEQDQEVVEEDESEERSEEEYDTLIIDGKEVKKTKSEIYEEGRRALQKEIAADKRLQEATKLRDDYQKLTGETRKQTREPDGFEPYIEQATNEYEVAKKKYVKAQVEGDQDEIMTAFDELNKAGGKLQQIEIDRETLRHQRETTENFKRQFAKPPEEGGIGDVFNDRRAFAIAREEANILIENGASPTSMETYRKAADMARKTLGWIKTEREPDSNEQEQIAKKKERKRKLDIVKPKNQKTKTKHEKDKPPSHDEVVEQGMQELIKQRKGLAI